MNQASQKIEQTNTDKYAIHTSNLNLWYGTFQALFDVNLNIKDGIIIIKSQQTRSQEKNREIAVNRLIELIQKVSATPKKRKATKPTRSSQTRRLDSKTRQGRLKDQRKKISAENNSS